MYTIRYLDGNGKSGLQHFDGRSRTRLALYLAQFPCPILDVYEQATLITETMRREMTQYSGVLSMSNAARDFVTIPR